MTSFVMSYSKCSRSIKGLVPRHEGICWFNPHWVRRYTCMPRLMRWCACVERAYSFKYNWVIITCLCAPASADTPIHFENGPGMSCSTLSTISTGPSCLSVGSRVHYLLSCRLHLQKCSTRGQDLPPHSAAHITIIGDPGWAPAGMMCGPISGQ